MSKTTKRKHVTREVLDEFVLPEGNQQIVKVSAGKGNNLHEVVTAGQEKFLVSMPNKFRKNVWIKRGDFVIIEPIEEGCKVKAEIVRILYPRQVKYIQKEGKWPEEFSNKEVKTVDNPATHQHLTNGVDVDDEDEDDDSDLFINTNRPVVVYYSDSSSDEDDSGQDNDGDDDADDDECR